MILKPNKFTKVNVSVIGLSSSIIQVLRRETPLKYNQLEARVTSRLGDEARPNFVYALTFLYALGVILYEQRDDIISLAVSE
jgi:hypothetical protein